MLTEFLLTFDWFWLILTYRPWVEALKADPAILDKIGSRNPRGKVGTASEAADVMVFLASSQSQLINGQVLQVHNQSPPQLDYQGCF